MPGACRAGDAAQGPTLSARLIRWPASARRRARPELFRRRSVGDRKGRRVRARRRAGDGSSSSEMLASIARLSAPFGAPCRGRSATSGREAIRSPPGKRRAHACPECAPPSTLAAALCGEPTILKLTLVELCPLVDRGPNALSALTGRQSNRAAAGGDAGGDCRSRGETRLSHDEAVKLHHSISVMNLGCALTGRRPERAPSGAFGGVEAWRAVAPPAAS